MQRDMAPVQKLKVAEMVENRLWGEIRSGKRKPGDPLASERELMRELNVGRPAIREAMQSLERKGVIDIRHGERARVAKPDFRRLARLLDDGMHHLLAHLPDGVAQMREARLSLEIALVRQAAQARNAEALEAMRGSLDAQKQNMHDPEAFEAASRVFHSAVVASGGNAVLAAAGEAMMDWLSAHDANGEASHLSREASFHGHQAIYQAIAAGDTERAAAAMTAHLTGGDADLQSAQSA